MNFLSRFIMGIAIAIALIFGYSLYAERAVEDGNAIPVEYFHDKEQHSVTDQPRPLSELSDSKKPGIIRMDNVLPVALWATNYLLLNPEQLEALSMIGYMDAITDAIVRPQETMTRYRAYAQRLKEIIKEAQISSGGEEEEDDDDLRYF